jgi:IS5 family transposase
VLQGNTRAEGKLLSVFEPETEVIRKGNAKRPNEFGKLVKVQEVENRLITHYEVLAKRPADSTLLLPSLQQHVQLFGCAPRAIAADPGFFSAANEASAERMGVKRVSIPASGTPGKQRKEKQKQRWFKKLQRWRTGCEGRISVLKRRHGLQRSRYKGLCGMKRWVGLGVIADNIIHIGDHMAANLHSPQDSSSATRNAPPNPSSIRPSLHCSCAHMGTHFLQVWNFAPESS